MYEAGLAAARADHGDLLHHVADVQLLADVSEEKQIEIFFIQCKILNVLVFYCLNYSIVKS